MEPAYFYPPTFMPPTPARSPFSLGKATASYFGIATLLGAISGAIGGTTVFPVIGTFFGAGLGFNFGLIAAIITTPIVAIAFAKTKTLQPRQSRLVASVANAAAVLICCAIIAAGEHKFVLLLACIPIGICAVHAARWMAQLLHPELRSSMLVTWILIGVTSAIPGIAMWIGIAVNGGGVGPS